MLVTKMKALFISKEYEYVIIILIQGNAYISRHLVLGGLMLFAV